MRFLMFGVLSFMAVLSTAVTQDIHVSQRITTLQTGPDILQQYPRWNNTLCMPSIHSYRQPLHHLFPGHAPVGSSPRTYSPSNDILPQLHNGAGGHSSTSLSRSGRRRHPHKTPSQLLRYWIPASMRLNYTRDGHLITLFELGQNGATMVGFDEEDKLFLWGCEDGSLMSQHEIHEDECYHAIYHWYVCMTEWKTKFETVGWAAGDKPDDPTCQKVEIKRVFI